MVIPIGPSDPVSHSNKPPNKCFWILALKRSIPCEISVEEVLHETDRIGHDHVDHARYSCQQTVDQINEFVDGVDDAIDEVHGHGNESTVGGFSSLRCAHLLLPDWQRILVPRYQRVLPACC